MPHTPELLLKAARKAYQAPEYEWEISNNWVVGKSFWGDPKEGRFWKTTFDINDGRNQMALQIALEREGWLFGATQHEFFASQDGSSEEVLNAKTKPELLLACIEGGHES